MMDWLSGLVGENTAHIISFIALFAVFLVLVFVVYAAIKRMTAGTYVSKPRAAAPRLTVTDAAAVDSQRRLVLVRRDDVEHLILIGGPTDIVIEQNIRRHKTSNTDDNAPRPQHGEQLFAEQKLAAPVIQAYVATSTPFEPEVADIIAAAPVYQPESELRPVRQHVEPAVARAVQPQVKSPAKAIPAVAPVAAAQPSQALQTHAQQVAAAARQQHAANPAPRANETPAAKLHPVYPLGQVSRGVVAATSGLAAANNAAQQEMIAAAKRENRTPSLDDVRPVSNQSAADGNPLVLQRATPQINRTTPQQEPSFTRAASHAASPQQQTDFDLDLENAVAAALSSDDEMSFESLLSSEMNQHFNKDQKTASKTDENRTQQSGSLNISARE